MKNKKGFTLIELLAVIVILAIIALIAVPIILNMIKQARKSAAKSAALGYIDAIDYNNGFAQLGTDGYSPITSGNVSTITSTLGSHLKGKAPTSGTVTIDTNGKVTSATNLCFNGYAVNYDGKDATVDGSCSSNSNNQQAQTIYYYQDESDKKTKLDPTWNVYAKEIYQNVTASSDIYEFTVPNGENTMHSFDAGITYTNLADCQSGATSYGADPESCVLLYENGSLYLSKTIEACINSSAYGGELCLNPEDDITDLTQNIKDYFEYDNTWTQKTSNSWTNSSETITCANDNGFGCADSSVAIEVIPDIYGKKAIMAHGNDKTYYLICVGGYTWTPLGGS